MHTKCFVVLAALFAVACAGTTPLPDAASPLPAPSGHYAVATRVLPPLVDASRPDERFAGGQRTILVQLWYPASARRGERAPYFVDAELLDVVKAASSAPDVVETWRGLRTAAVLNGAPARRTFPLILFSHGFGVARAHYTTWVQELASRGFIVAAIDHPFTGQTRIGGRNFSAAPHPDGPAGNIREMARDLSFAIPRLLAELGARDVAAVGHSIGGTAALEACRTDARVKACVNLDGSTFDAFPHGIGRPFLVIHQQPVYPDAKPDGELARAGREVEAEWQRVLAAQPSVPATRLAVRGTGHYSFTDAPFVRPSLLNGGGVLTEPRLVLRATSDVIAQYLRNALAGRPDAPLALPEFIAPARLGEPWRATARAARARAGTSPPRPPAAAC